MAALLAAVALLAGSARAAHLRTHLPRQVTSPAVAVPYENRIARGYHEVLVNFPKKQTVFFRYDLSKSKMPMLNDEQCSLLVKLVLKEYVEGGLQSQTSVPYVPGKPRKYLHICHVVMDDMPVRDCRLHTYLPRGKFSELFSSCCDIGFRAPPRAQYKCSQLKDGKLNIDG
eukprot:PLAT9238.1.p1 GENE.PLAT9238.1~~PLAT9238.1.p1  ORF type:complete len:188 (+),score=63.36 PLAT9238.1:53-565(+)